MYSPKVIPETSKQQARQTTESCAQHKVHVTMCILSFSLSLSFQYRLRDCDYFNFHAPRTWWFFLMPTHERKYHLATMLFFSSFLFVLHLFHFSFDIRTIIISGTLCVIHYFRQRLIFFQHILVVCVCAFFFVRKRFLQSMLSTTKFITFFFSD